jgi:hypothetical protein
MSQREKIKQTKPEDKIESEKPKRRIIEESIRRQIYLMRLLLAIIAGIISGALPLVLSQSVGFAIGIFFYALSQYIAIKRYRKTPEETTQILTIGIFSYTLLWIIIWSLTVTLINPWILSMK